MRILSTMVQALIERPERRGLAEYAGPPEDPAGYSDCDATAHSGLMGQAKDAAVVGAAAIRAPRAQMTIFWPEP